MAEELEVLNKGTKAETYRSLLPQLEALMQCEDDLIANMANITAALKETFGWLWVGFYLVKKDQLVLGPFQGPIACTRIGYGKGVCGTSWREKKTIIVPDVDEFPGHIACSSASRSEIVVPLIRNKEVLAILDIDSSELDQFDQTDKEWLEKLVNSIPT